MEAHRSQPLNPGEVSPPHFRHDEPLADAATLRRVIVASSLGTLFEWYDFYLYGSLTVFFGSKFFPAGNETAQLLASLAAFGAGFGVRPLGAIVFGHVGDLIGRKYTFLVTMATMGLSTALIGMLPTYSQIGLWATALLVALRLLRAWRSAASTGARPPTSPSTCPTRAVATTRATCRPRRRPASS
jgi:MFS family permease